MVETGTSRRGIISGSFFLTLKLNFFFMYNVVVRIAKNMTEFRRNSQAEQKSRAEPRLGEGMQFAKRRKSWSTNATSFRPAASEE